MTVKDVHLSAPRCHSAVTCYWATRHTKLPLPIAASEGDKARKPNETIKIQKRETTLPTTDRSFPLCLTEDSTQYPHCTRWLAASGRYQRPMLFSRLNLELERKEKREVVECVTAFKTTRWQGTTGNWNGLKIYGAETQRCFKWRGWSPRLHQTLEKQNSTFQN